MLERLEEIFDPRLAITFNHIKRKDNKVGYILANLETETQRTIKAQEWMEVIDVMSRDSYRDLTNQDIMGTHGIKREGKWDGPKTTMTQKFEQVILG